MQCDSLIESSKSELSQMVFRNAYTPVKTFFKKKKNSKEGISMKLRKQWYNVLGINPPGLLGPGSALFLKLNAEYMDALFYYYSLTCISAFYVLL